MHRATVVLGALGLATIPPSFAEAQDPQPTRAFVRIEAGTLNADDPLVVTMALGASVGRPQSPRSALILRYIRQSQDRNLGAGLGSKARSFLTVGLEHAFTDEGRYKRQLAARLAAGALFRPSLAIAPLLSAGLVLRYGVHRALAFVGSLEDDVASLPRQDFTTCGPDYLGNEVCRTDRYGGKVQHNFGFLVAIEWRP